MSDHATTIDALRRGAAPEALAAAREAVAAQPDDATAQRLLAAALRLSGEREAALEAIDRAIDLAPDDANLHLERAGLMLDGRKLDEAEASLARSVGLDPNQFPAYIIQGQLALGRGDLDEAERLARTAARIAPEHPQVAALEGSIALRRGDADTALARLSGASERYPEDLQLRHALGFAYMAKGHFAFAEQAFRSLKERYPQSRAWPALIADLLRRQGRPAEAADEIAPLLDMPDVTPGMKRLVGQIELEAGRNDRALELLRDALAANPTDSRTLLAAVEAWHRMEAFDDARSTLDAALATHPASPDLWRARLAFETFADNGARDVVDRWLSAMPDHVPALMARSTIHQRAGETEQAESLVRRIAALEPGHAQAELRLVDSLLARGDHDGAVARVDALIAQAQNDGARRSLQQMKGRVLDLAGRRDEAVAIWVGLQQESAASRLPLQAFEPTPASLPALARRVEGAGKVLFLWGAPGSSVERLVQTLACARAPIQPDRFGPQPPRDGFQRIDGARALDQDPDEAVRFAQEWRDGLKARRLDGGQAIDWLLWWDNRYLHALRAHVSEAELMVAIRDPRDMLLDWLAWGAPVQLAMPSVDQAAIWLADALGQVADVEERALFPLHLVRMDDIAEDPAGLAAAIGTALRIDMPAPPRSALGAGRFRAGHWRAYAGPLAEAFAVLTPVARRLGYPEA